MDRSYTKYNLLDKTMDRREIIDISELPHHAQAQTPRYEYEYTAWKTKDSTYVCSHIAGSPISNHSA
jgi:hypothetical protein